jgi:hypothetical protein
MDWIKPSNINELHMFDKLMNFKKWHTHEFLESFIDDLQNFKSQTLMTFSNLIVIIFC